MKIVKTYRFAPIVVAFMALNASPVFSGGLMLYEVGTDNTALANAGAAARAQGPSTLASNIAGMSYLQGTQITAGAQVLRGDLEFESDSTTTNIPGNKSGNIMEWAPGGSFFITRQLDDKWSAGFAAYGDFGLSLDYNNNWQGRYFVQDGEMLAATLLPSLAYRINDQWSVGAGLRMSYAIIDTKVAIDNSPLDFLQSADGQLAYKDKDWGFGTNLGVIYEPTQGTRLGLAYTSEIHVDFNDRLDLQNIGPVVTQQLTDRGILGAPTDLDTSIPQTLTASLYQQINSQWAFLASANWQDWSQFGEIGIDIYSSKPRSAALDAQFDDTWHLSAGVQYRIDSQWQWNAGIGYDSELVDDENRTLTFPVADSWRFATGVDYAIDPQTTLNLGYSLVWIGDVSIDQQKPFPVNNPKRVSGEFEDASIQALSLSMTWKY